MTKEEFLDEVKEKVANGDLEFRVNNDGMILSNRTNACILCAVMKTIDPDFKWTMFAEAAAFRLGISEEDCTRIMEANDNEDDPDREKIMEACGLL